MKYNIIDLVQYTKDHPEYLTGDQTAEDVLTDIAFNISYMKRKYKSTHTECLLFVVRSWAVEYYVHSDKEMVVLFENRYFIVTDISDYYDFDVKVKEITVSQLV